MGRGKLIPVLWIFSVLVYCPFAHAKLVVQSVPYTQADQKLEGYLAYDDSMKGKRPGVLVVHEWWGLNDYARHRADQLAELGYVAFALDMYGQGKSTKHPEQASEWMNRITEDLPLWRARALAGLDVLRRDPRVDPGHIAAVGYCFGGGTVQQLAYSGADLDGIVSFHGPLIPPPEHPSVPVKAKFLVAHGSADPFVKKEDLCGYLSKMNDSGLDWQMIIYGGAKHSFTNPQADQSGVKGLEYNARADRRSWADMRVFLDELFQGR